MSGGVSTEAPLDAADYDPIVHLNMLFSHPSTVSTLPAVSRRLRQHAGELTGAIAAMETAQAYGPGASLALERMQTAQARLAALFGRIEDVRGRAVQTEQDITTMTAEIKRLDGTKRNLTVSMTALKRLQMLTTAYEQLRGLARARQYRDCAGLLLAVLQLMRHFHSYRSIEQIAALSRGVGELQRTLLEQVCEDFEMAFAQEQVVARRAPLAEAALVVDALGEPARARLVTWYVNTALREYRTVFRGNDEAGSLDNIGRRYAWFRRMFKTYEDEHAALFPAHWRVHEALATAFCDGTRDDFRGILERSMRAGAGTGTGGSSLHVNLLLGCLQETLDFEQGLERRFASTDKDRPRASIDTLASAESDRPATAAASFHGAISVAFEPCLSLWVDAQDGQLAALMPRYRTQPLVAADDEFTPESVAPSAIELFHVYKVTLSQCAKLSTGERLLDLARILAKYLDEYAQQVLMSRVGGRAGGGSGSGSGAAAAAASSTTGPPAALRDTIVVLNTADFWYRNTTQLEESLRKRIDGELAARVDLTAQADAFLGVASSAVQALVRRVEADCDSAWREMRNTGWSRMESVGDHSAYVSELTRAVDGRARETLAVVAKPQYARAFCDHLVEAVASAYIANVVQCRPVTEVAAEQMLLDKYALTKSLEGLLALHPASAAAASASTATSSFVRRVAHTMGRVDPLLKTLQVRPSPPEALVQAYLIHIADRSEANFRKILDLKGVRKLDQAHLVELFIVHRDSAATATAAGDRQLVPSSPLLTPLMNYGTAGGGGVAGGGVGGGGIGIGIGTGAGAAASSTAAAVTSITARFDAASSLGEKLLNAARDGSGAASGLGLGLASLSGVASSALGAATSGEAAAGGGGSGSGGDDASPSSYASAFTGTSGGGSGAATADKSTINDNLKNIGKFFRRDIGALGARFGKRDLTPTGERD